MQKGSCSLSSMGASTELDILEDTHLSLVNSRPYLTQVLQGGISRKSSYPFEPKHSTRRRNFRSFNKTNLASAFTIDPPVALADFELAVQDDLDDWVTKHLHTESACVILAACITHYSDAARPIYASNSEDQSLMLLTIFELWVALDKMALAQCPLLQDYSPEVPLSLLEPFLLRKSTSYERLASIEKYLRERHRRASSGSLIFASGMNEHTLAVRYFQTSPKHKDLLSRIEKEATLEREAKVKELRLQNASHEALMDEARSLEHKTKTSNRGKCFTSRRSAKNVGKNRKLRP